MPSCLLPLFGLITLVNAGKLAVKHHDGAFFVTAPLPSGLQEIHAEWLRERCLSPAVADVDTYAPLFSPHEIPRATITGALSNNGQLSINFTDVSCEYNLVKIDGELQNPVTNMVQVHAWPELSLYLWDATIKAPVIIDYNEWRSSADTQQHLYEQLFSTGNLVLRNVPREAGQCQLVANNISIGVSTNYDLSGGGFNVVAGGDGREVVNGQKGLAGQKDLAYTSGEIRFHVDGGFRESAPDFQLLHAIDHCECPEGATQPCDACYTHNFAVDSMNAAMLLLDENPAFFRSLATVPVRFENNGGFNASAMHTTWPIIEVHASARKWLYDPDFDTLSTANLTNACAWRTGEKGLPCIRRVRFSIKAGGYLAAKLPIDELNLFYAAKRRYSEILDDPQNRLMLQLRKGDIWVMDNRRMLHARSAIPASDGRRWLQGCYAQMEEALVRYEPLRRDAAARRSVRLSTLAVPNGVTFSGAADFAQLLEAAKLTRTEGPLDLREHALQSATRAARRGESDDTVVAALVRALIPRVSDGGTKLLAALKPYLHPTAMDIVYDAAPEDSTPFYPSLDGGFFTRMIETILQRKPDWWSTRNETCADLNLHF